MTLRDAPGGLERFLAGEEPGEETVPEELPVSLAERRRLHRRGRFRFGISPRALTTTALCLVALLGAWWAVTASAPARPPAESPAAVHSFAPQDPSVTPTAAVTILVHVSGAVRHPGIVRLPGSARVFQAVEKAGGALDTAELDSLNLAETLQDGRKIHVPERGGPAAGPGTAAASPAGVPSGEGPVHLNSATEEQLMTLPRVGKVLAGRIIAWREQHGAFGSIEDLDAVDGIGPRLLEQLTPLVAVDGAP